MNNYCSSHVKLHANEIFLMDEFPNQISPWNKPTELSCIILYHWKVSSIGKNKLLSTLIHRIRTCCHNHCIACFTDVFYFNLPRVEPENENLMYVVSFSHNASYLVIVSNNNETSNLVSPIKAAKNHVSWKVTKNKKFLTSMCPNIQLTEVVKRMLLTLKAAILWMAVWTGSVPLISPERRVVCTSAKL